MSRDYTQVLARCRALAPELSDNERAQAVSDAIWDAFAAQNVSWVGFYFADEDQPDDRRLVLGASRDKPACSPIGLQGVCGSAYRTGQTQIVEDIRTLGDDYIACDPRDLSEIVIPIFGRGASAQRCIGVLDVDSYAIGAFDQADQEGLCDVLRVAGYALDRAL